MAEPQEDNSSSSLSSSQSPPDVELAGPSSAACQEDSVRSGRINSTTQETLNFDAETPQDGNDDGYDDDDVTVIILNNQRDRHSRRPTAIDWIEQTSGNSNTPEISAHRRSVLIMQLRHMQRASFTHFALLCLVPTILLITIVVTILSDSENCDSSLTVCTLEPRSFSNAFTTRCVCESIPIEQSP